MKFRAIASILFLVLAAVVWRGGFFRRETLPSSVEGKKPVSGAAPAGAVAYASGRPVPRPAGDIASGAVVHPEGRSFGSGALSPEREMQVLLDILEAYRREFGAFPTGEDNAGVLNALAGGNSRSIWFFPRPHPRLDSDGNLLDRWGKPYFFHQISRDHLEIRSCGADGELFTADDFVHPPPRS